MKAGQQGNEGDFMGHLLHNLMFYRGPQWVFTACYITFAVLWLAPSGWPHHEKEQARPVNP